MKRTLKTTIAALSLLLITSLVNVNEVRAEEIKKDQQTAKPKASNQEKVKYSQKQKDAVIQKIQNKQNLNLAEQKIRIEILKEQYPMDWYEDMFKLGRYDSGEDDCGWSNLKDTIKCNPHEIIDRFTPQQIKSIILHADDDEYSHIPVAEEEEIVDYKVWRMIGVILKIVNELDKAKTNPKVLETNEKLILKDGNIILLEVLQKDIKNKFRNIYDAYSNNDNSCGSSISNKKDNCLPFNLSEIGTMRKSGLILQVFKEW